MAQFTLRLRRWDPESEDAPYWDEHTVELPEHNSVLEGILQAKARNDGSIGIRCSCRAAICGSCGWRDRSTAAPCCSPAHRVASATSSSSSPPHSERGLPP